MITTILTVFIGIAGGIAVGASVTALFTTLGVPARIIQWSEKPEYLLFYQISLLLGALVSCLVYFFDFSLAIPGKLSFKMLSAPVGLLLGTFVGMIAAALTETLDIISTVAGKLKMLKWIYLIVAVIILGKMAGSLLFFIIPGFF